MYAVHKVIKIRKLPCIQYINRLVKVRNSKPLLLVPKIGVPLNPLDFPFNQLWNYITCICVYVTLYILRCMMCNYIYITLASFTFDKEPAFQIEFHSLHVRFRTKDPGCIFG